VGVEKEYIVENAAQTNQRVLYPYVSIEGPCRNGKILTKFFYG